MTVPSAGFNFFYPYTYQPFSKIYAMIQKETFQTQCADGVTLKGILLIPESPKAIVQFNGGTAAKKEFYLPFLEYLASHNYACCLWDYRGNGESAPPTLKNCNYNCQDYGIKDMPTIKDYLVNRFPNLPILLFGHSVGGQQAGFMHNLQGYIGMVGYAISTGYLKHMPIRYRLLSNYFFFIFTPISIALTGYLAAKRFNIMEDLPKNVVREWRDWCMKKDYFFDPKYFGKTVPEGHFHDMPFPIHIFWATDDYISNKNSVPTFWSHIHSKHGINFTKITPQSIGAKSIDHFGFFKKRLGEKLWPKGLAKLDEFLAIHQAKEANSL